MHVLTNNVMQDLKVVKKRNFLPIEINTNSKKVIYMVNNVNLQYNLIINENTGC